MLAPEQKKKKESSLDEVETYKNQLKMVFRLIDTSGQGAISRDQLVSVMRNLGPLSSFPFPPFFSLLFFSSPLFLPVFPFPLPFLPSFSLT